MPEKDSIDERLKRLNRARLLELMDHIHPGEIPIGAVKRRSLAVQMKAQIFRIGNKFASNAFLLVRGELRLVYVRPSYVNYRRLGLSMFGNEYSLLDFDHSLGRALAESLNVNYVLLLAIDRRINRGHGAFERVLPPPNAESRHIDLRKHCYVDSRVMNKWLGLPAVSTLHPRRYERTGSSKIDLTDDQLRDVIKALGFGVQSLSANSLSRIYR